MPGNEQQDYNDLHPLQTEHHPQPFSIPGGIQQEPGCSDNKGQPVVVGSPNTDISSFLELSAGSSQLSGSQPSVCKYSSLQSHDGTRLVCESILSAGIAGGFVSCPHG
jgi:hypothetical protein